MERVCQPDGTAPRRGAAAAVPTHRAGAFAACRTFTPRWRRSSLSPATTAPPTPIEYRKRCGKTVSEAIATLTVSPLKRIILPVEPRVRRTAAPMRRHVIASQSRLDGAAALRLAGGCQKVRAEPEELGHRFVGSQGFQEELAFVRVVESLVEIGQGEGDPFECDARLDVEA